MNKLMFLDVETTGVDKNLNAIHQLSGCVIINNVVVECFDFKIRPFEGAVIEQEALDVGGVTKESLFGEEYIPEAEAYKAFSTICSKYINKFNKKDKFFLVGYNVHFDKDFMYNFFVRNNDNYFFSFFWGNHIDVMVLAAHQLMDKRHLMTNFKQGTVAKFLGFDIKEDSLHNSLYDIFVCLGIYCYLTKEKFEQTELLIVSKNEAVPVINYAGTTNFLEEELKTVLKFGKYNGKQIQEVFDTDYKYLIWVYNNVDNQYSVSKELYEKCLELNEKQLEQQRIYSTPEPKVIDHFIDSMGSDLDTNYPF